MDENFDNPAILRLLKDAGFPEDFIYKKLIGAGSDRLFYRIIKGDKTAILMTGTGHGAALDDWLEIQIYLEKLGFGVPKIYAHDLKIPAIVVEDFGQMSPPRIESYPKIARELARLAVIGVKNISECPIVQNRPFDFSAFIEESEYFSGQYLKGYTGIPGRDIDALKPEFASLAEYLSELPKAFCHRDFQSSNISIHEGHIRIIDFQSAKFGPYEYDLASLLWDSRVEIPQKTREETIAAYLDGLENFGVSLNPGRFRENLHLAALSRCMQSLGAYCFLSDIKGKRRFEKLIPPTEIYLKELIDITGRLKGVGL